MGKPKGRPIQGANVSNRQKPKARESRSIPKKRRPMQVEEVDEPPRDTVVIRLSELDLEGPWCLTKISRDHHLDLLQRLSSIEQATIPQLSQNKVWKDYKIEELPTREATKRLIDIGRDDETRISRLEISGLRRLYGFRRGNEFFALWWDPDHKIWPSQR